LIGLGAPGPHENLDLAVVVQFGVEAALRRHLAN
jgi:hypothetical protein